MTADEQAAEFLQHLATRKGPISDALTGIARRLKSGDIKSVEGARKFLTVVRRAMEAGGDSSADVGGAVTGADGQREPAAGEPEHELAQPPRDNGTAELFQRKPTPPDGPDLFGRERPPAALRVAEPTIRSDMRQGGLFGMEPSAVQAVAARDQTGRGGLLPSGEQRPANEGLFAAKAPE